MSGFADPPAWSGSSSDPNDVQFGDVVEGTALADADSYDRVLVGEPYDGAVIGRTGARDGPAAIRESLAAAKAYHFEHGTVASVGDLGDVRPPEGDVAHVQETVADVAAEVHALDATPVFLGGDNSLTYGNVRPLLDDGAVGVVSLDAHLDCREVGDEPSSGTPYRQLFDAGLDALAVVGARHFETTGAYHAFLREQGGRVLTASEVGESVEDAAQAALATVADVDTLYVSLDVDVLDGALAPGVSAPTPGGLTAREVFALLRAFAADDRVAGFEVVETAPRLDSNGHTTKTAARAVAHFLSAHTHHHA
ncbi:formimidoylglutamase [Halocalculus aciditolerans]|uniref:Formimidoylglutamase n=1 Tax=Halocalculus aciditolerans TaxID=1383812 RepID=A0A830FLJ5_9EURY|nr:formimidoylglutamase [Halocalculus aciditolerans]GGL58212.1 formimidoylglutamase [Halocalculus aciditolerans]